MSQQTSRKMARSIMRIDQKMALREDPPGDAGNQERNGSLALTTIPDNSPPTAASPTQMMVRPLLPAIYAVPTSETFDEGGSFSYHSPLHASPLRSGYSIVDARSHPSIGSSGSNKSFQQPLMQPKSFSASKSPGPSPSSFSAAAAAAAQTTSRWRMQKQLPSSTTTYHDQTSPSVPTATPRKQPLSHRKNNNNNNSRNPLSSSNSSVSSKKTPKKGSRGGSNQSIASVSSASSTTAPHRKSWRRTNVSPSPWANSGVPTSSVVKPPFRSKIPAILQGRDFQWPQDWPSVSVAVISLQLRSAYQFPALTGYTSATKSHRHLSPSPQHHQVLRHLRSGQNLVRRQVCFLPSCGLAADPFVGPSVAVLTHATESPPASGSSDSRRSKSRQYDRLFRRRDGRYHPMDVVQACVVQQLASGDTPAPVLSHRKLRLPTRADVGFARATQDEIMRKQKEIQHETAWEEATPRLAVLVASTDLGCTVGDELNDDDVEDDNRTTTTAATTAAGNITGSKFRSDENSSVHSYRSESSLGSMTGQQRRRRFQIERAKWNGTLTNGLCINSNGKLQRRPPTNLLPWAGPDLCRAWDLQAYQWGRQERLLLQESQESTFSSSLYAQTSPLAPPLGAVHSRSQLWRSRAIHDRPPGMQYTVACPMEWQFLAHQTGPQPNLLFQPAVPLIGCLTLYRLRPSSSTTSGNVSPNGKMSESFYFPAGYWDRSKIFLKAARRADGTIDNNLMEAWQNRPHKAIFAHEAIDDFVGTENRSHLFLVVTLLQLAHHNPREPWTSAQRPETISAVNQVFQQHGTQLLAPLAWGLTPLDHGSSPGSAWPQGSTRQISLHWYPQKPMSNEALLDRLEQMTYEQQSPPTFSKESGTSTATPSSASRTLLSQSKRSRGMRQMFRTSTKPPRLTSKSIPVGRETAPSFGRVRVFVSDLGGDFLRSLLECPPELSSDHANRSGLPRLLVDPTGDGAVMLQNADLPTPVSNELNASCQTVPRKRSDLVRLPPLSVPAGYAEASEFREVLSLPARPEKNYDVDAPPSLHTLVNLLFVYPRSLRVQSSTEPMELASFTVRLRTVQMETERLAEMGETSNKRTLRSNIHSRTPWIGSSLTDTTYSNVVGYLGGVTDGFPDDNFNWKHGVPLSDEFKLRLPHILDGSHSLEFTLFRVQASPNQGVVLQEIGSASFPLSSSSTRDSASGSKVATVIPNGMHRIKLGGFELKVETRLLSSIHVSDPAVAVTLRDFPYALNRKGINGIRDENSAIDHDRLIGQSKLHAQSTDSSVDAKENFSSLLSAASPSTVLAHFESLLHVHLCNLVSVNDGMRNRGNYSGTQFLMGTMHSLFELLRKAKDHLQTLSPDDSSYSKQKRFMKFVIDMFDEAALSSTSSSAALDISSDTFEDAEGIQDSDSVHDQSLSNEEFKEDEGIDEVAVRLHKRIKRTSSYQIRLSKIVAELGESGINFSRAAYGASKVDRMRLEAEMKHGQHLEQFFEDDETIATMSTFQTAPDSIRESTRALGNKNRVSVAPSNMATTGPRESSPLATREGPREEEESPSMGNTEFAKRVKNAAQVMLAPCVGPTLSHIFSAARGSPRPSTASNEDTPDISRSPEVEKFEKRPEGLYIIRCGSEEENDSDKSAEASPSEALVSPDGPTLQFSARNVRDHDFFVSSGTFIYETIILLWLRAWLEHIEVGVDDEISADQRITSFVLPLNLDSAFTLGDHSIYSFFGNIDFFLPLCLKSLVLRYSVEVAPLFPPPTKVALDEGHLRVLEPFVEMLARGLIAQALAGISSSEGLDSALLRALQASDLVNDFLTGLIAIVHPEQLHILINKYFRTFRDAETEHLGDLSSFEFDWTQENLCRVRAARQLRLQAIERFATLPAFISINYPPKYSGMTESRKTKTTDWLHQCTYSNLPDNPASNPAMSEIDNRLPTSGWLSTMLISESLSICSLSSESVVAEAMAHIEVTRQDMSPFSGSSSLKKRPGASLRRGDLLMFQSIATQAITCVYELIIRRHTMDRRYQSESARERIAALFAGPILEKSVASVRWLARMEATHRVRSTWLLCLTYVIQETPEFVLRDYVRTCCDPKEFKIHRFVRLLRLCTSTFQSFLDRPLDSKLPLDVDKGLSSWLLQESFNTVCVATNTVVEACVDSTAQYPNEQRKLAQGLLDLLLHVLTTPQSSVTHLRAIGGALQALEKFGVELFLEVAGGNFQHWIRVILSLMNSMSLSVRSISVDFTVSLLGSIFDNYGSIDEVSLIIATILPEVAAREIAMYSVAGHVKTLIDASKCVWPLRRSLADLQDANPLDDDRIDPQLSPILSSLCRACQAIIDGVLIEIRLRGNAFLFKDNDFQDIEAVVFDADEESLFEAANFFLPEIAPMQRIRWFMTLNEVHIEKGQWVEGAESLIMCCRAIVASIRHLKNVWRPSKFALWSDTKRAHWLETVGEESGDPDRGIAEVVNFADEYLEPPILDSDPKRTPIANKLQQPTASSMCSLLSKLSKEAVNLYLKEKGMKEQAFFRLETLQQATMSLLDDQEKGPNPRVAVRSVAARKRFEEDVALRKALVALGVEITSIADQMFQEDSSVPVSPFGKSLVPNDSCFVVVRISGRKTLRFQESVSLPAFLEWGEACICRVPTYMISSLQTATSEGACVKFAEPLLHFLTTDSEDGKVVLKLHPMEEIPGDEVDETYLEVFEANSLYTSDGRSPSFLCRRFSHDNENKKIEMRVAHPFPCPLSRQRSVLTTETPLSKES